MLKFKYKNEKRDAYEMAYIIYMMAGSYYKTCNFANPETEKRLYLYYQEMRPASQISAESSVDRVFQKAFCHNLEQMQKASCTAACRECGRFVMLEFQTPAGKIQYLINKKGVYTFRCLDVDGQVTRNWDLTRVIPKDKTNHLAHDPVHKIRHAAG